MQRDAVVCLLCNKGVEPVNHLFFTCFEAWRVCNWWLAEWGISWCILGDATTFFVAWNTCSMKVAKRKVWRMSFFTIVWSL